jgi:hypothetical protein
MNISNACRDVPGIAMSDLLMVLASRCTQMGDRERLTLGYFDMGMY